MRCYSCKTNIQDTDRIGRRDTCEKCSADLHVCKNCQHYDTASYNECRETSAERVLDKEAANFCDYFAPATQDQSEHQGNELDDAKKKLAELFKK